jgi:hypothetical protein
MDLIKYGKALMESFSLELDQKFKNSFVVVKNL